MLRHKPLLVALAFILLLASLVGGCAPLTEQSPNPKQPADLDVVEEAWELIFEEHVDRNELDKGEISRSAIRGMIEALDDPYSGYLPPEMYEMQSRSFQGLYQGIGAYITESDGEIMVVAPIADSPAEKAGIRPGDKVLEIDGESTAGITSMEAGLKIRGPVGTEVNLLVLHEGETEPVVITITRAEIELKSVGLEMLEEIAYISIATFTMRTPAELLSALEEMPDSAVGIVLDLRNNPGGILDAVVDVAGQFLDEGAVVVRVRHDKGEETPMEVEGEGIARDLPLVVLVNGNSASGSELLAGALQDHDRAKVAGSQTFGKGTVNALHLLKDGSALYLSVARWFTPQGRPINGVGIAPDFPLELEGEELVDWAIEYIRSQVEAKTGNLTPGVSQSVSS